MSVALAMLVREPPLDRLAALVAFMQPVVTEVVIVDTGSPAETVATMRSWDDTRVIEREWRDDFAWARNEGLAECQAEWTLVLDPDELPSLAMLDHVRRVDRSEVDVGHAGPHSVAVGWLYWTRNWWAGLVGPEEPYHWHCRLFRTGQGRFYRPIHELVELQPAGFGWMGEDLTRGSWLLPNAPRDAYLIHSKGADEIARADVQYAAIGAATR